MKNLSNILFIDIETVSTYKSLNEMNDDLKELWQKKCKYWINEDENIIDASENLYVEKAGIYAEFAKVVCISVGIIDKNKNNKAIRLKSFFGENETEILQHFSDLLNTHFNNPNVYSLCGHNIKEFDIPFLARRMIINKLPLPHMLDIMGKKPWETKHLLDTIEMWKFGDYKNYTSLNLLSNILGIKSPKDDIDGSMVGQVYWKEKDLERIRIYCEKDVKTVAQVYLRMNNLPLLDEEE